MQILSVIQNSKWSPGIGDPTVIGWLIFAAYITAAILCGKCTHSARKNHQKKQFAFWLIITIILALLAANKQLDIQTWLTHVARKTARKEGWYAHRQTFQMWVVSSMAAIGTILIAIAGWIMRKDSSSLMTIIGLILLLTFIVIRAASHHSIDHFLAVKFSGQKRRYLLELAAIMCIAISAAISYQQTATSNQLKKEKRKD